MDGLTAEHHEQVAELLRSLPFVSWDRYVPYEGMERLMVYGWVRGSGRHRSDFVLLDVSWDEDGMVVGSTTSSVERSREISRIVHGEEVGHVDCRRVHGDLLPEKGSGPQGTCSRCEMQLERQADGSWTCPCGEARIDKAFFEAGRL